ncbi:restriction endonuclease subunit S [Colwellia sp. MB02u-18]|uniref:restriction endonuclease subunit S n=1 Tax=unclassified Colwellia TaxID=196834 RepID=UPI0015F5729F|nr:MULTISPECIES: restriction endonuclease subunit S [unclassified Colwellia]MBA6222614.1 restriction endonuclease subunit S [Colwellia sp. MB3u-45]MBA6266467.1 restriction endonuclease subunit S [Colwellia sp. MB3u-43]MBA6322652.1 restriction endonuclease subunit S [Colwellia sp. MB02u-19]MBA6326350.1 restriction endonuclease subunit S [Colwellia sp. MB02u-18]MBA6332963.1 restriction endonuclease subunit S [Colwellia sp. MB02u-12]
MKKLNEIFEIKHGNKFDLNKMKKVTNKNNSVSFVSRTAKNNGVSSSVAYVGDILPFEAGNITVALGGSVLSSFVQAENFYTGQNVAVLLNENLSLKEKLFYCIAIKRNAYRYQACGREANRTLADLLVPSIEDIPDWVNELEVENPQKFFLPINENQDINLEYAHWKPFKYKELFDIGRGRGPRKKDLTGDGSVPFISASEQNNGLTGWTTNEPMHSAGVISVVRNGNSVASAFYQEIDFCSTEDVHIFEPKFKINQYIALFLCTLIKKEKYRFNYGRKWSISRMRESEIRLPITNNGEPDYAFMENYIKSLSFSSGLQKENENC